MTPSDFFYYSLGASFLVLTMVTLIVAHKVNQVFKRIDSFKLSIVDTLLELINRLKARGDMYEE